jgi:hypothetical protein
MNDWNLLVIVVDRLNAGFLGPYGNTWVPTAAVNRLASEAWLAEFAFATSPALADAYRSYWRGVHPLATMTNRPALPEVWQSTGRTTVLITDEPEIAALPEAAAFAERVEVRAPAASSENESSDQTQFAHVIGAAIERLSTLPSRFVMWVHARGLSGAWDAPPALREHVRDEEDPPAATFLDPPALRLPADYDPDELVPITQAYAAQVLAIDECLEPLLETLTEQGLTERTLVVLTSPRGCVLGQHRHVGPVAEVLLEDLLHVPLLVRYPNQEHAAEREPGLLEPRDLYALLQSSGEWTPQQRDRLLMVAAAERAFRTPAWHVRLLGTAPVSEDTPAELYAKPDDRYEVNDVAARCQSIVGELVVVADETAAALRENREAELAPLSETLVDTYR